MDEPKRTSSVTGTEELRALNRSSAFSGSRDRDRIINEVLDAVEDLIACERALLFIAEREQDGLRMFSSRGGKGAFISFEAPSIIRRVFSSRAAEIVNDVLSDVDVDLVPAQELAASQVIAVPLLVGDEFLGVLTAINSTRGAFASGDLRVATIVADRAALAMDSSSLAQVINR
jgi:GAF domain-containing protein